MERAQRGRVLPPPGELGETRMQTVLFSVGIFVLSMAGLAVGLFFGRAPIKGSCGGIACGGFECGACPKRLEKQT